MTTTHRCCSFISCTSVIWIFCSTSRRFSIGLTGLCVRWTQCHVQEASMSWLELRWFLVFAELTTCDTVLSSLRWPISACHSCCRCSNTPCLTYMRFLSSMRRSWHVVTLIPVLRLCLWMKPMYKCLPMLLWAFSGRSDSVQLEMVKLVFVDFNMILCMQDIPLIDIRVFSLRIILQLGPKPSTIFQLSFLSNQESKT